MSEEAPVFDQAAQPPGATPAPTAPSPAASQPIVTATPTAQPPVQMPPEVTATPAAAPAEEMPEEWPTKGYDGPQPWEVTRPPALCHNRGILISGSAGDEVLELAACLGRVGYETSISRGEN